MGVFIYYDWLYVLYNLFFKKRGKNKMEEMWVLEFEKDETENWIWNKRGQLSFGQTL